MLKQKSLLKNQSGFAHTMLIVSLLVIVGIAAVGYRVFTKSHADIPTGLSTAQDQYMKLASIGTGTQNGTPIWNFQFAITDVGKQAMCTDPTTSNSGMFDYQVTQTPSDDSSWVYGGSNTTVADQNTKILTNCDTSGPAAFYSMPQSSLQPGKTIYFRVVYESKGPDQIVADTFGVTVPLAALSSVGPAKLAWHWTGSASYDGSYIRAYQSSVTLKVSDSPDMSNAQVVPDSQNVLPSSLQQDSSGFQLEQPPSTTKYYALYTLDNSSVMRLSNVVSTTTTVLAAPTFTPKTITGSILDFKWSSAVIDSRGYSLQLSKDNGLTYSTIYTATTLNSPADPLKRDLTWLNGIQPGQTYYARMGYYQGAFTKTMSYTPSIKLVTPMTTESPNVLSCKVTAPTPVHTSSPINATYTVTNTSNLKFVSTSLGIKAQAFYVKGGNPAKSLTLPASIGAGVSKSVSTTFTAGGSPSTLSYLMGFEKYQSLSGLSLYNLGWHNSAGTCNDGFKLTVK